ncbi:hypothetical protein SAMN02745181_0091 [Rubritalea squalenifaciens DSM 18772]|uniref:Uncharacterized protein n=1 Tax=Rubritalea squalenifaciens DSM 18772 TaxID=1123071 RepID=A0A1M6B141_9BACT|nr:hypothetical protein [Rubritalea squalenifaciens]SHI42440.1 hypothetical protein SAMN02745181_0091 [Rubritalea squalenifaciens DSM 18772]
MKYLFASLCLLGSAVSAQDGFDPTGEEAERYMPKVIQVQVEYIEVPQETVLELLYGEKKSANDSKLRDELQKLLKEGKATMMESQMVVSRSGERASAESIREYIYPTEYEPAEVPNKVDASGEKTGEGVRKMATGPTPTAFETRNLGSTLEVEPTLSESAKIIDLWFAPELVWHVKNEVWAEWRDDRGNADVKMPIMYTLRVNTGLTMVAGRYHLACCLSPKDKDGFPDPTRKVMMFVKADVLKVTSRN